MIEHLSQFIPTHGYWLTFVGSLFEGETMLVLAGLAVNRGYLVFTTLLALGALGGFLGDQIIFGLGRRYGSRILERFPSIARRAAQATSLVERYPELSVLGVRFMYGLRLIGPITIGMSRIGWLHFAGLNAIGAVAWSSVWLTVGYVAGAAIEAMLGSLKHVEHALFGSAVVVAVIASVLLHLRRRRAPRPRKTRGSSKTSPVDDRR